VQPQRAQVTLKDEAAGACLVDDVQRLPARLLSAQRLAHCIQTPRDAPQVSHFAITPGICQRDIDTVLVHIQADVHTRGR